MLCFGQKLCFLNHSEILAIRIFWVSSEFESNRNFFPTRNELMVSRNFLPRGFWLTIALDRLQEKSVDWIIEKVNFMFFWATLIALNRVSFLSAEFFLRLDFINCYIDCHVQSLNKLGILNYLASSFVTIRVFVYIVFVKN
jgi:hypothetical protein